MSHDPHDAAPSADPSVGELVTRLSEQTSRLVRDELLLAKAELRASAKHAGLGAGLFGTAGVLALFGLGTLITAAVAALSLALPLWASALIVAAVLLVGAGIAALVGKKQMQETSLIPERAVDNIKRDVQEVQETRHHDHTHRP